MSVQLRHSIDTMDQNRLSMWRIQWEKLLNIGHGGDTCFSCIFCTPLSSFYNFCLERRAVNQDSAVLRTKLHPLPDDRHKRTNMHKRGMLWTSQRCERHTHWHEAAQHYLVLWMVLPADLWCLQLISPWWSLSCWVFALLSLLTLAILKRKARLAFWFCHPVNCPGSSEL